MVKLCTSLLLLSFLLLSVSSAEVDKETTEPSAPVTNVDSQVVDSNEAKVAEWSGETSVNVSGRLNEASNKVQADDKSNSEKTSCSQQSKGQKDETKTPCPVEPKVEECQVAKATANQAEEKAVAPGKVEGQDEQKSPSQKKDKSKRKRSISPDSETQEVQGKKEKKGKNADSLAKGEEKVKSTQGKVAAKPKSVEEKPKKSTKPTKSSKNGKNGKNGKRSKKDAKGKSSSESRSKSSSKDRKKRSTKSKSRK